MAFIKNSELKEMENDIMELREEVFQLTKRNCELDLKLFNTYGEEMLNKITDELGLTSGQRSKLGLIFSVEHCRIMGVPEDSIIHDLSELDKFFMSEECD